MSKERVMNLIDTLARSQGYYGRLSAQIREAERNGIDTSEFFDQFQDCTDDVDVILKIEG